MGYSITRILQGQLVYLIGLLLACFQMLIYPLLQAVLLSQEIFWFLPFELLMASALLGGIFIFCGAGIMVVGTFFGKTKEPFELFGIGLGMIAGAVGFYVLAGLIHWNPTVSPFWRGPGPKPEAAIIVFYSGIQLFVSLLAILRSIPFICMETAQLSRTE